MKEKYIKLYNGKYEIPIKIYECQKKSKKYIIACHGFGGDKESSAIYALAKNMCFEGFNVISFDLPEHGQSDLFGGKYFTVENCLNDLKSVYNYILNESKSVEVDLFSTSFGAYLTLIAIFNGSISPKKIVLRAPAIKMDEIFVNNLLREDLKKFKNDKVVKLGFERDLYVNYEYYMELKKNDLFKLYNEKLHEALIIQGSVDDVAPIKDTKEFIKLNPKKIKLFEIEGADHRFKKEGEIEKVIDIAKNYYLENKHKN